MKSGLRILGLLVLLVSTFKLSAQYNYELKTTEDMMLLFDQSPDQMHKTVVVFEEQLDIEKYERMFKQLKTSSDDRKVIVATELREIASRSQEAILPKIIAKCFPKRHGGPRKVLSAPKRPKGTQERPKRPPETAQKRLESPLGALFRRFGHALGPCWEPNGHQNGAKIDQKLTKKDKV